MEEYKFYLTKFVKKQVASIGWKLFTWGSKMSKKETEYWNNAYYPSQEFIDRINKAERMREIEE